MPRSHVPTPGPRVRRGAAPVSGQRAAYHCAQARPSRYARAAHPLPGHGSLRASIRPPTTGDRDGLHGAAAPDCRAGRRRLPPPMIAAVREFFEQPHDDHFDVAGDFRVEARRRRRRIADMLHRHTDRRIADERQPPRQHLIEDDARAVRDHSPRSSARPGRLLRRDVPRRAERRARVRHADVIDAFGDAEVHHFRGAARVNQDIMGLDIAMDDAMTVGVIDCRGDLRHHLRSRPAR